MNGLDIWTRVCGITAEPAASTTCAKNDGAYKKWSAAMTALLDTGPSKWIDDYCSVFEKTFSAEASALFARLCGVSQLRGRRGADMAVVKLVRISEAFLVAAIDVEEFDTAIRAVVLELFGIKPTPENLEARFEGSAWQLYKDVKYIIRMWMTERPVRKTAKE